MTDPNLYHPDLSIRYRAVTAAGALSADPWPSGCWGAANAWLILIGPSPGSPEAGEASHSEDTRPKNSIVWIGDNAGVIKFAPETTRNKRRNTLWNKLTAAVTCDPKIAAALTAMTNLDWRHSAREKQIILRRLSDGCETVWNILKLAKPRVVMPLTDTVYDMFGHFLKGHAGAQPSAQDGITVRPPLVFQIPEFSHRSLFLKSPKHPSYPMKSEAYAQVRKTVADFLTAEEPFGTATRN